MGAHTGETTMTTLHDSSKVNGKILAVRGGYDVVVSRGTAESRYGTYRTVAAAVEGARELGYAVLRTVPNGEIYLTRA